MHNGYRRIFEYCYLTSTNRRITELIMYNGYRRIFEYCYLMECQKQKNSNFYGQAIYSLLHKYKHCKCPILIAYWNYIYIACVYFNCNSIFPLQSHIFIACLYFHCNLIFTLQKHTLMASGYSYCSYRKRIFSLLANIFIVSAYFHCNSVEKFLTLC